VCRRGHVLYHIRERVIRRVEKVYHIEIDVGAMLPGRQIRRT
jgi:hypothetical protein